MAKGEKNSMKIDIKLDEDFSQCFDDMVKKYGKEMQELNGLGEAQLDYTDFIDNFIDKNCADVSIDANANVGQKDIVTLEREMSKPHSKLLAFNKIFYEMKKKYGLETAREWMETEWNGGYYLHDFFSATFKSYCFAYDLKPIAEKGLFFIKNSNAQPPKHLTTFTDFVGETVSWTSNRTSGACGLPNFLIYSFYFWKKDVENGYYLISPEYYRDQEFQRIIYKLNQPFLRVDQSSFTNFSIFDTEYIYSLFGGKQFPGGSEIVDYTDEILEYEKAFMVVCSKIRSESMMTFPVLTFSLLRKNGKFVDEDFAKWCCRHNMKWADSNFYISADVTSLSNCCFDGAQMTLTKASSGVNYMSFKELYEAKHIDYKRNLTIFHNGSWVKGKVIRLPASSMVKITTANNKELLMTKNHIQPVLGRDKLAGEITTDDYILFNARQLDTYPERNLGLTYEQGYLVGMYLGDGSMDRREGKNQVNFSLNESKYAQSIETMNKALAQLGIEAEFKLGKSYNNVYPVHLHSIDLKEFIAEWVEGKYGFEKELNMDCLLQSAEFRKGIVDGYYATDGGNSNRIYTTSKKLAYEVEALFTSLGIPTIIDISDRTDEPVIIRGEEYTRNYPLYCIRSYSSANRRNFKGVYKVVNNSVYFKVKSIEDYINPEEYVYCFEMENQDEPYFTLPNGVITHNCRLVSNVKNLGYFNSIGGTALEVGSVKVNTLNLARMAYESGKDKEKLKEILKHRVILCAKTLDRIRHIIERNIEKGLLPNYTCGLIHLDSQYSTLGLASIFEMAAYMGWTYTDEEGLVNYTEEGLKNTAEMLAIINETKEEFRKEEGSNYQINVEQVPAERCAYILQEKDKFLYPDGIYNLPLYGNQWIPLGEKTSLYNKIHASSTLDKACSGGSISHINIDAPFTDFDMAWDLLNKIADMDVPYFAFCTRISACEHNHGFYGETCPICGGKKVTTYQRVVGFLTPERNYSKERKAEFKMRDWFKLTSGEDTL